MKEKKEKKERKSKRKERRTEGALKLDETKRVRKKIDQESERIEEEKRKKEILSKKKVSGFNQTSSTFSFSLSLYISLLPDIDGN